MGLYLDKIPSVALKAQSDGKAPPKTDIFALMTFFLESISYGIIFWVLRLMNGIGQTPF